MSEVRDRSYYLTRAEQEAAAGYRATDKAIADIHFELAYRYSLLAKGIPTLALHSRARG